jgi:hypothetical protein
MPQWRVQVQKAARTGGSHRVRRSGSHTRCRCRFTLLLICATALAQNLAPEIGNLDSTLRYDDNQWRVVKQLTATFDTALGPSKLLLLESLQPTSTGGAGQPVNDVDLLIIQGGRIVYDYVKQRVKPPDESRFIDTCFYMDDYLELKDVTDDGAAEVLFHSGFPGASDATTVEHVLLYDRVKTTFIDVAPAIFSRSGTHGLRWLVLRGRTFAVIADRNWPPTTPVDDRCHYCESPFKYDAYRWSGSKKAFVVYRRLFGTKSYSEAGQALTGDLPFIQSRLSH